MLSLSELLQLSDPVYRPSEEEAARFPVHSESEMRALHSRLDISGDENLDQHELLVSGEPPVRRRQRLRTAGDVGVSTMVVNIYPRMEL